MFLNKNDKTINIEKVENLFSRQNLDFVLSKLDRSEKLNCNKVKKSNFMLFNKVDKNKTKKIKKTIYGK